MGPKRFGPRNPWCMARTWNEGMGGQCRKRPYKGSAFCWWHCCGGWKLHGRIDGPVPKKKLLEFKRVNAKSKLHIELGCGGGPALRARRLYGKQTVNVAAGSQSKTVLVPFPQRHVRRGEMHCSACLLEIDSSEAFSMLDCCLAGSCFHEGCLQVLAATGWTCMTCKRYFSQQARYTADGQLLSVKPLPTGRELQRSCTSLLAAADRGCCAGEAAEFVGGYAAATPLNFAGA
mmetsp:Transcript_74175/g.172033  ORF Transcript_74175/g.172033 Transcript_74175/m.172033 type:complete len:232 (+) Transcript_74175:53-748(+)